MINAIKKIINRNIHLKELVLNIAYGSLNREVKRNMDLFSKIDSIDDVDVLEEAIKNNIQNKDGGIYAIRGFGAESLHYGHIQNLYAYSNLEYNPRDKLPMIEHGITYDGVHTCKVFNQGMLAISQGDYIRDLFREGNKNTPLFSIGPFIHYASNYYSEEKINKLRSENGKTMLVFPFHTHELSNENHTSSDSFVKKIMSIYNKSYDTLYVCAYWLDLDSAMIKKFKEKGAIIISAGARFDPKFLQRLKTIISLSDVVYSNDIGTNIGYAMYLNKPYFICGADTTNIKEKRNKEFIEYRAKIIKAFSNTSSRDQDIQNDLYECFWGGLESVKTPLEIEIILKLNKKLVLKSYGSLSQLNKIINRNNKLNTLKIKSDQEKKMLIEALK